MDGDGNTPLMAAAVRGHEAVLCSLLDAGADQAAGPGGPGAWGVGVLGCWGVGVLGCWGLGWEEV